MNKQPDEVHVIICPHCLKRVAKIEIYKRKAEK